MDTAGNTAIAGRRAQTQIVQQQDVQLRLSLIATLAGLSEARQASVSQETLELYAECLSDFPEADVRKVARELAMRRRGEGETAFPALGDMVEPLRLMRRRRREMEREAEKRKQDIEEFWRCLPEAMAITGLSEEQWLERHPSYKGTKPE